MCYEGKCVNLDCNQLLFLHRYPFCKEHRIQSKCFLLAPSSVHTFFMVEADQCTLAEERYEWLKCRVLRCFFKKDLRGVNCLFFFFLTLCSKFKIMPSTFAIYSTAFMYGSFASRSLMYAHTLPN